MFSFTNRFSIWLQFLLFAALPLALQATTEKYRVMWRDDPSTTMVVGWNQVSGSNPVVYYGTTDEGTNWAAYPLSKTVDRTTTKGMNNQFARLTGLTPNTVYYFVIKDTDGTSARFSFKTVHNDPNQPLYLVAGGDSRSYPAANRITNQFVSRLRPDAILFGGDYTDGNTNAEWDVWFDDWQLTFGTDGRIFPIVTTFGNHEGSGTNLTVSSLFDNSHADSYYALTFGGSLLRTYTLNTEMTTNGTQATWLASDLAANNSVYWKFAQYHRPLVPHQTGKVDQTTAYNAWAQLFYDYNVRLVVECDAHVVKATKSVRPTGNTSSSEACYTLETDPTKGTVYMGEGTWALTRTGTESFSWSNGVTSAFTHINWIKVTRDSTIVRTVKTTTATGVGYLTDGNRDAQPANIQYWTMADGEDSVVIYRITNQPPVVTLTAPTNGQVFGSATTLNLAATASDPNGTVSSVAFYVDGVLRGTDNTAPYGLTTAATFGTGTHTVYAIAYDNNGASTTSATHTISIGVPPSVSLSSPANGQAFAQPQAVTLNATASDNVSVSKVEFFVDGVKVGEDLTSPYSYSHTFTVAGTYTWYARATDSDNLSTTTASRTASVGDQPTGLLLSPAHGAHIGTGSTVDFQASASDVSGGTINKVEFFVNGTKVGEDLTAPYTYSHALSLPGSYALKVRATDNDGLTGESTVSTITYGVKPSVSLVSPVNGQTFGSLMAISLQASAADADGSVTNVEFYVNGVKEGEDLTAPYALSWTLPAFGSYSIYAIATDDDGLTTQSASATIEAGLSGNVSYLIDGSVYWDADNSASFTTGDVPQGAVRAELYHDRNTNGVVDGTDTLVGSQRTNILGYYQIPVTHKQAGLTTSTVSSRISGTFNDVEEEDGGPIYETSSDLELADDPGTSRENQKIGLRFTNLAIPQGADIVSAKIVFTCDEASSGAVDLDIFMEDAENPVTYTDVATNVTSRSYLTDAIDWSGLPSWTVGTTYETPNLATLVQQVVNKSGWSSGNAMAFMITGTGTRTAEAFDGVPASAPLLVIEYASPLRVIQEQVATGNDDAEENIATGVIDRTSSDLELTTDGANNQVVGIRFSAVDVPQGATITSAYLQFQTDVNQTAATNLTIAAHDADNAAAITTTAFNLSSRVKTTATVAWNNVPQYAVDVDFQSPDIKTVVQEVVDRGGWASGNAMTFLITGTGVREVESYDGEAAAAPKLFITYEQSATNRYVVKLNPADLPPAATVTTGTEQSLTFTQLGTSQTANFGFSGNSVFALAVADNDGNTHEDEFWVTNIYSGQSLNLGHTGSFDVEAMAIKAIDGNLTVFAANGNSLGTLSTSSGVFSPLGTSFGTANGALGAMPITDVDGLTYDHAGNVLWATHANPSGNDVLVKIDPFTGAILRNAFGPGTDYLEITGGGNSVDDIAIDPTAGILYAVMGGQLFTLNTSTGLATDLSGSATIGDIQGIGFNDLGQLFGSTGSGSTSPNSLVTFNKTTGTATTGHGFSGSTAFAAIDAVTQSASVPLPLQLIDLEVFLNSDGQTDIAWATRAEQNISQFVVEKSTDGQAFTRIAAVAANNRFEQNQYNATDSRPAPGVNYYRLRVEELDGAFYHSPIVSLLNADALAISLFPNPVKAGEVIHIEGFSEGEECTISLLNLDGRVLQKAVVPASGQIRFQVEENTASGVYVLMCETAKLVYSGRIVIR